MDSKYEQSGINSQNELFVKLLFKYQSEIYAYIMAILHNWNDAEDVFQDAMVIMCRKFSSFEPGSNFAAWACQIAKYEAYKFRKKNKKLIIFDPELQDEVLQITRQAQNDDERIKALRSCVAKLDGDDRFLIQRRYEQNDSVKKIAEETKITVRGLYNRLARVQCVLLRCVRLTLQSE